MKSEITVICKGREYTIHNSWQALTPQAWLNMVRRCGDVEKGRLSVGELRIRLLCDMMGWKWRKIHDEESIANLVVLSEQLTFPFRIAYRDESVLDRLTNEQYARAVRTEPEHIGEPWAERLCREDWHYELDLCFFHQLLPTVTIGDVQMFGYKADNHHGALSTSLTALQFIEACETLSSSPSTLHPSPSTLYRLAAILYAPEPYNSNQAHAMAEDFSYLKPLELQAIYMNFEALVRYLYTKTPLSLLTKFDSGKKTKAITTTMQDALYDLCRDGLGSSDEVERMNALTYLSLLRKNTIDVVRQLHGMDMDIAKIANETGLPPEVIAKIV